MRFLAILLFGFLIGVSGSNTHHDTPIGVIAVMDRQSIGEIWRMNFAPVNMVKINRQLI